MKTLFIGVVALALSGCASMPQPQEYVPPQAHIIPKVAHKVEAAPPTIATPLVKPKWYDRFRQKNGKWVH